VKLTRTRAVFNGYISADGTNWTFAGSVTNDFRKNLSAGLALTAHNNSVLNSTLFESVTVAAAVAPKGGPATGPHRGANP
jgi:hypothetical protein